MIKDIQVILGDSPLDVRRLNVKLRSVIDYIYALYSSVSSLVGMTIMVENTIVFGNWYRSLFPDIDSELTGTELCLRNGQYTKVSKTGIQCIEKMHPGAYEKLINKKDSSILNAGEQHDLFGLCLRHTNSPGNFKNLYQAFGEVLWQQ